MNDGGPAGSPPCWPARTAPRQGAALITGQPTTRGDTVTSTVLCVADHCGIRHQHQPDCPNRQTCPGCLPRPAADGLRLCEVDTRRIAEDARTAAVLYEDMGLVLIRRGRGSERVSASSTGAPIPDSEVMEARDAIYATLTALVRMIAYERGIAIPWEWRTEQLPDGFIGPPRRIRVGVGYPSALAEYIAKHATWLAAHPAADEHARDLRDIAGDPRTRRLAYPAGTDRLYIGDCPLLVADLDGGNERWCETRLYVYGDQPLVLCSGCGTEETIEWWQRAIVGDATKLVDAYAGAAELAMRWARPVDPALIRKWASLGKPRVEKLPPGFIGPPRAVVVVGKGKDGRGRTLYDLDALRRYAELLWGEKASTAATVAA